MHGTADVMISVAIHGRIESGVEEAGHLIAEAGINVLLLHHFLILGPSLLILLHAGEEVLTLLGILLLHKGFELLLDKVIGGDEHALVQVGGVPLHHEALLHHRRVQVHLLYVLLKQLLIILFDLRISSVLRVVIDGEVILELVVLLLVVAHHIQVSSLLLS